MVETAAHHQEHPFLLDKNNRHNNNILHHNNNNMISMDGDESSGHLDSVVERDYTGLFEGPEKTLEVVFRRTSDAHIDTLVGEFFDEAPAAAVVAAAAAVVAEEDAEEELSSPASTSTTPPPPQQQQDATNNIGLRQLTRPQLDQICARARCTILSQCSNKYLDAYILSESSLFIYPYMLVLKTCGTTTLLRCIAILIEFGKQLGLEIDWVGYSRKNFNFPGDQAFPHQSFHQELQYLYSHRTLSERLHGNGYTLGPVTGDHWFVFVADHTKRRKALEVDTDRVLNIMMFDIDEQFAQNFYYESYLTNDSESATATATAAATATAVAVDDDNSNNNNCSSSKEATTERISRAQTAHIQALCPGATIDARAFEPCGYSMNAILFRSYTTIHVTPEVTCSYASFETNQKVQSYQSLVANVLRTFQPQRFVLTLMADEGGLKKMVDHPFGGDGISSFQRYRRHDVASIQVEDDCCCLMGNWVLQKTDPTTEKSNPNGTSNASSSSSSLLGRRKKRGISIS
jgi:S-adenosylmethionine decarboxylase